MDDQINVLEQEMLTDLHRGACPSSVLAFATVDIVSNVAALRVFFGHPALDQVETIGLALDVWGGGGWMHGRGWILAASSTFIRDFLALDEAQVKGIVALIHRIRQSDHPIHQRVLCECEQAIAFLDEYLHKTFA
jgi:hypothetical protein